MTGYIITYQQHPERLNRSVMADETATNITITGLMTGTTYSISIVATSSTLPSIVTTVTDIVGMYYTSE